MDIFNHNGVDYVALSREEAVLDNDFPKEHRQKLTTLKKAKFVILKAIDQCDDDRKYICEIEN